MSDPRVVACGVVTAGDLNRVSHIVSKIDPSKLDLGSFTVNDLFTLHSPDLAFDFWVNGRAVHTALTGRHGERRRSPPAGRTREWRTEDRARDETVKASTPHAFD